MKDRYRHVIARFAGTGPFREALGAQPQVDLSLGSCDADSVLSEIPNLRYENRTLYCDGKQFDFRRRPMFAKLFDAFLNPPVLRLSRQDLMRHLYGDDPRKMSLRRFECSRDNLAKLMSRARTFAQAELSRPGSRMEWFVAERPTQTWKLVNHPALRAELLEAPTDE